ncbi:MAG: hypothetical protein V3V41_02095 [Candidatus Heimdallarchaeota archaeon]
MSEYVIDTSNQHPKIKPEAQLEEFLIHYELFIGDYNPRKPDEPMPTLQNTFNVYGLIWAKDSKDAFKKAPKGMFDSHYYLKLKEVIGAVKDEERRAIHDKLHDIGGGIILP